MKNRFTLIFGLLIFGTLYFILFSTLAYPPISDDWHLFSFFHQLNEKPGLIKWLHVLNYDPCEHMRFQPLSRIFYYMFHITFGSNFIFFKVFNFMFYIISIIILYKLSLYFSKNKLLNVLFMGLFAILFNHFDIVLWAHHIYIIVGLILSLMGFISYMEFLKTNSRVFVFLSVVFFLSGMLCYEPFFFWPLGILILSAIKDLNEMQICKVVLIRVKLFILSIIYILYFAFYFFTRSLGTYGKPVYALNDFLILGNFVSALFLVLFNILYNGFVIAIFPWLSFPLKVTENVYLSGPIINIIQLNQGIVFVGAILFGFLLIWGFVYLCKKKYFKEVKILLFLFFLLFSYSYIIFFCRLIGYNNFEYCLTEFRYQYVSNAIIVLIVLFIVSRFIEFSKKKKYFLFLISSIIFISNIYCIYELKKIYNGQLVNLQIMLSNIRQGLRVGYINKEQKLYIQNDVHDYLPSLCWNIYLGGRFISEGNYHWLFSKKDNEFFSNTFDDAVWIIDKDNFSVIKKDSKLNFIKNKLVDLGKDSQYLDLGSFYLDKVEHKKARFYFKRAIAANPRNSDAYRELGEFYVKQREYDKAIVYFKKAIKFNPNSFDAYNSLANLYVRKGEDNKAIYYFEKSISINRYFADVYNSLGDLYSKKGDYVKAIKFLEQSSQINPNNPENYMNVGNLYLNISNFDQAIVYYQQSNNFNPNSIEINNRLGDIYNRKGEYDKAIDYYEKSIHSNNSFADVYYSLGEIYNSKCEYEKAIQCFEQSSKINPNNSNNSMNLGNLYFNIGEYDKAESYYQKTIQLNANATGAYKGLGDIYKIKGDYSKSLEYYEEVIKFNPHAADIYTGIGDIYNKKGDYNKAIEYCEKAFQINPHNPENSTNLGNIYAYIGNYDKSISYYQKALKANPNSADIFNNLGNIYRNKGNYNQAIEYFEKAIQINPYDSSYYSCLGDIFCIKKDSENVAKQILNLRRLGRDDLADNLEDSIGDSD